MNIKFTRILVFGIALLLFGKGFAQKPETNLYELYKAQFSSMLSSRGSGMPEISDVLKKYDTDSISSDSDLALLLQKLYSDERGIAVLFYFYHNDTLRIALFEPGKIIETKSIHVSKEEILQLGEDLNFVLDLFDLSKNRMPLQRGVKMPNQSKATGATFDSVIKRATALLIPAAFDIRYKHLLVIPALNIGAIPFHILRPYKDSSFLIENCSFTIVPDLISMVALRYKFIQRIKNGQGRGEIRRGMEDIAPTFDDTESNKDSFAFYLENPLFICNPTYPRRSEYIYPDLPGAEKEIQSAIPFAQNYILLKGDSATKKNVLANLTQCDMAYFATHGMASSTDPMNKSFLVLSGADPYLTARDIMDLRFGRKFPEMVILSACQTGLGKSMEAGITGLARSFLLAGSYNVVMSLWSVDDNATAYLMNRFVYHLQKPSLFMPSEPLRQAILDTKKIYPKPSHWASFSLFGIDY